MDDLELLRQAMIRHCREQAPRDAYIDELMDRTGMTFDDASDQAQVHWMPVLIQWEMRVVLELVKGEDDVSRRVQWWCVQKCDRPASLTHRILVAASDDPPTSRPTRKLWAKLVAGNERIPMWVEGAMAEGAGPGSFSVIVVGWSWVMDLVRVKGIDIRRFD